MAAGFSLTELMVVVAIIGIIASLAIPAYDRYATESRRSEARAALMDIASLQAEYVINHSQYAGSMAALGMTTVSENGYYGLSVNAVGATSYTATATARDIQAGDSECAQFQITQTGARTASSADCW